MVGVILFLMTVSIYSSAEPLSIRGVVYDVGVKFGGKSLSTETFDSASVAYDMHVLRHLLRCNTVRIEGEDIQRLTKTAEIANSAGLRIFFNPWKHEANADETASYLEEAAKEAEKLRNKGADITFVTSCEYSLFCRDVFPGETFNDRMRWMFESGDDNGGTNLEKTKERISKQCEKLNYVLARLVKIIRKEFAGHVTYSAGTWEDVDWNLFDIIGVDYYRGAETDEEYVQGLERYKSFGKPVVVMEMGSCAYEGAAQLGGGGFMVLQGSDSDGNPIWKDGVEPVRSEKEQADYIEYNIGLLEQAKAHGVFVYVFKFPIYPYKENGTELDKISYSLVKSFAVEDPRSKLMPAWEPKEAFYRLGALFSKLDRQP